MALLKCSECGHSVSSFAMCCPNCGCPVSKIQSPRPGNMNYEEEEREYTFSDYIAENFDGNYEMYEDNMDWD